MSALTETGKPFASLSLDLDNQWSYMKSGGIDGWQGFPSYLDVAVPRILDTLRRDNAQITFFVVGQDAALPKNREALRAIARDGHEIANHSFHHEPWLNRQSRQAIAEEIGRAHAAIAEATGQAPRGFRGPGFSLSTQILEILSGIGYDYDASTFPTFIGPLARSYYFLTSGFDRTQREERAHLFGTLADGLRSLRPYRWALAAGDLVEVPVTTIPLLRAPFHLSYLAFLAGVSTGLALAYFRSALAACKLAGVEPSLLLHPLDFLGADDVDCLGAFPGMKLSSAQKLELVGEVLRLYSATYEVHGVGAHAARAAAGPLTRRPTDFAVDRLEPLGTTSGTPLETPQ